MDPEARRRACAAFRVKLSRDTGTNLTAAVCEELLGSTFEGAEDGELISLESNPGNFYVSLGDNIAHQTLAMVHADHFKVAWFCYREAAEVHTYPWGMRTLASCYRTGEGVEPDPAQAAAWLQRAVDTSDPASIATLGAYLVYGNPRAEVVKDAARGFELVRQAFAQGFRPALYQVVT